MFIRGNEDITVCYCTMQNYISEVILEVVYVANGSLEKFLIRFVLL